MTPDNLTHSLRSAEKENGRKSVETTGPKSNNLPVRLGTTVAALSALAVLAGTPKEARADIPTCDVAGISDGLPSGADDPSVTELYISKNDTDGINTYYCAVRDTDGDWSGNEYACWDGATWQDVDFSGTSLDTGYDRFGSTRIIEDSLYADYGTSYKETGSGLDWNDAETNLSSTESVGSGGMYFTYDPYTDKYYYGGSNPVDPSHDAIMEAGDATYAFIENADIGSEYSDFDIYDAGSCGDGNLYINGVDWSSGSGDFRNFIYDFDSGEIEEITDLDGMVAPACDYDGISTTTLYLTDYASGTPYQITCTHGGATEYTYYDDADGDGYGNATATAETGTSVPAGHAENNTDCDDGDATVHPGATETCNGTDDNCDGSTDEGVLNTYYRDFDSDGHGTSSGTAEDCTPPSGYVSTSDDCDDRDSTTYPGAPEACDGNDNDCSGAPAADEVDSDGDSVMACNGDCDDTSNTTYPGAPELCDGINNDCDDETDEDITYQNWYPDTDRDGYGDDSADPISDCADLAPEYSRTNDDCDDGNSNINPGETELTGDSIDNDCNGLVDGEDPDAVFFQTEGDCQQDSSITETSGTGEVRARVKMNASSAEDCEITLLDGNGLATISYGGSEVIYDCTNPADCYYVFIPDTDGDGTYLEYETGSKHNAFIGLDQFWLFTSGTSYSAEAYRDDGVKIMEGSVIEPTVLANVYNESDDELRDREALENVGTLNRVGDSYYSEQTSEGMTVSVNGEEVYTTEDKPDTGDTGPDDTAEKPDDTGEIVPPTEGCPGCSAQTFDSTDGVRTVTGLAAMMALLGLRRRSDKKKVS